MISEKSIEVFARAALSGDANIVDAAFDALKSCGKEALPSLMAMLEGTSDIHLMERVCRAIAKIGPENEKLVSMLIKMLADNKGKGDTLIVAIINALRSIGSHAKAALPNLYELIDLNPDGEKSETNPEIQIAAINAISAIDRGN